MNWTSWLAAYLCWQVKAVFPSIGALKGSKRVGVRNIGIDSNLRTAFLHASGSSLDLLLAVNPSQRALFGAEGTAAQLNY